MKTVKVLSIAAVLGTAFASFSAQAGMTTDAHGNVGYDTAAECDAAVLSGNAKFYQSFTHKSPLKRSGETGVTSALIRDLGPQYAKGACDVGVGRRMGRDGVSTALQGKYIPFSPDMPVNVYTDAAGKAVRVTMAQCDNWFSDNAPRAVVIPAAPVAKEEPAPVVETVAPAVVAPVLAKSLGVRPYVFGTVGAARSGLKNIGITDANGNTFTMNDSDARFAGQAGLGLQFNNWLGLEGFYQDGSKHKYSDDLGTVTTAAGTTTATANLNKVRHQAYGARFTVGNNVTEKLRLFGKVGAAQAKHTLKNTQLSVFDAQGNTLLTDPVTGLAVDSTPVTNLGKDKETRVTAGLGATYNITDKLAVRADYDHYFKKSSSPFKASDYLGLGLQYKF